MVKRLTAVLVIAYTVLAQVVAAGQVDAEKIDLETIAKIKQEGTDRSKVMEIASYLTDVYGPRLTGSPNFKSAADWTVHKLGEWGLTNARLDSWGPFGRGWTLETFSAGVVKPTYFPLIAFPKAWSPSTKGTVSGDIVYLNAKTEADLEKYKGTLKNAIVMIGQPRGLQANFKAQAERMSDERLQAMENADPAAGRRQQGQGQPNRQGAREQQQLVTRMWQLCYSEGAALTLEPGRGDGGTVFVQSVTLPQPPGASQQPAQQNPQQNPQQNQQGFQNRPRPWSKDAPVAIPQVTLAAEHYNRLVRMVEKGVKVRVEVNIKSSFHDQDLMGYNVIAEIPGTDLKDEIVMLGAHFDSWHSGTGATDNGAGSAVCLEAVRILKALGLKPRRTIRIALWGGEEQGLLGSRAFVDKYLARRIGPPPQFGAGGGPASGDGSPSQPGAAAAQSAPQQETRYEYRPDYEKFAGYFNLDNGTGKIRGVYLQGNDALRPIFRAWLAPFKEMGASTLTISNTGGTDHQAFDGVGLPGFQFIQDQVEYDTRTHHSNMDVYDRLQEDDLKQASIIMASFVYNTAMRDQKLPRKQRAGGR